MSSLFQISPAAGKMPLGMAACILQLIYLHISPFSNSLYNHMNN